MPLSQAQRSISDCKSRFRVAICGRRFGKTHLAIRELARFASQPDKEIFYVAPSYRQAKQIVWRKLKYKLQDLRWIKRVNESELTITLKNGSTISLKGAENSDSLRGVGLDFLVMDEFADIDPIAWYEVLRPTLSDKRGEALFIGTPKGRSNWSYDLFINEETNNEWTSFQFTTLDGGNVSAEEIESAKQDLDERTFRQEFMATFETYSGRIYYAFDRTKHLVPVTNYDNAVLYTGWDFNIDPMSIVIAVRNNDQLTIIDEIRMFSSNTQEAVDEIKSRYPKSRIWAFPDPACKQRKTSAGGNTDLTILQNAGFVVKVPNSHTPVRDRINAVNSRLMDSNNVIHLFVQNNCKYTIEGLERHTYKEGTQQPDKSSGYDHQMDALGYLVDYLFPIKRDIEPIEPQRWGHAI